MSDKTINWLAGILLALCIGYYGFQVWRNIISPLIGIAVETNRIERILNK